MDKNINEEKIQITENDDYQDKDKSDKETINGNNFLSFWQAVVLIVSLLIFIILLSFITSLVLNIAGLDLENDLLFYLAFNIFVPVLSYGLFIGYMVYKKGFSLDQIIGIRKIKTTIYIKVFFLFLGYLCLLGVVNNLIQLIIPISDEILQAFDTSFGGNYLLVLTAVCLIAPITEETIFRGIVLKSFSSRMSRWKAIILSALLFGFFHLNVWQGISAFFLGLLLGWLYIKTGALKLAIFAHAANNFIAVSIARLGAGELNLELEAELVEASLKPVDFIYTAVLGLIIFLISLFSLKKDYRNDLPISGNINKSQ